MIETGVIVLQDIDNYTVENLLSEVDDSSFVKASYNAILGRSPDAAGLDMYTKGLMSGSFDRIDVLIGLAESPEGRKANKQVLGLQRIKTKRKIRNGIYHLPLVGKTVRWLRNLIYISRLVSQKHFERTEQRMLNTERRLTNTERLLANTEQRLGCAEECLLDITNRLEELNLLWILDNTRKERVRKLLERDDDEKLNYNVKNSERVKRYSSVFEKVKQKNGEKIFLLDLGCGNGEWINLVQQIYGIYPLGVDKDEVLLAESAKKGLNIVCADFADYIKSAAGNSVDIITVFRAFEHMPIEILNVVVNECYRVLRKNGALIIESADVMYTYVKNMHYDMRYDARSTGSIIKTLLENAGMCSIECIDCGIIGYKE